MARRSNRLSRVLILVLLLTLGIGAFAYFRNNSPSKAEAQSALVTPAPETHVTPASLKEGTKAAPVAGTGSVLTTQTPVGAYPAPINVTPVNGPVAASEMVDHRTAGGTKLAEPGAARLVSVASNAPAGAVQTSGSETKPTPATAPAAATDRAAGTSFGSASSVVSTARTQVAAGDYLTARAALNAALESGKLSSTESADARKLLTEISQVVYFSPRRFDTDPFGGTYKVVSGDNLAKIGAKYEITPGFLQRLNGISDPKKLRAGQTIKIVKGPFHAIVSKSDYLLDVYLGAPGERGSLFVTQLKVGLGKSDSTPTGVWAVRAGGKLKNPKFWGAGGLPPMDADDPKNPLGEYWIALEGMDGQAVGQDGYGIHGTIDPASIGTQASLGCIRLKDEDIALVYDLLVDGKSTVTVKP